MRPQTDLLHVARPSTCNTQQTARTVQQPTQQASNKTPSLKELADGILSKSKPESESAGDEARNSARNTDATSLLHSPVFERAMLQQVQQPADPVPSPLNGMECSGCDNLEMKDEHYPGSRRRFRWRCLKGHELLEARRFGARITISPPGCTDFTPWKAGTQ